MPQSRYWASCWRVALLSHSEGTSPDFQDFRCSGTQSSRRVNSQTVEILRCWANGGWTRFVRQLPAQPKELVLEITEQNTDGRHFERRLALEKQ